MWGCHLWLYNTYSCVFCVKLYYLNVKNTQNEHLVKMCKCRVVICDYKYLVLRGLHIFYVLLGPILVLDWFKKRLVQTCPRTMQDWSRLVLSGPVLVHQYSEIFRTRPDFKTLYPMTDMPFLPTLVSPIFQKCRLAWLSISAQEVLWVGWPQNTSMRTSSPWPLRSTFGLLVWQHWQAIQSPFY